MNAPAPIDTAGADAAPLHDFVAALGGLVDRADEAAILSEGSRRLADLVSRDGWLPAAYAAPDPSRYQQYLLHRDPANRFSVVSFVWAPGQATPVHDHRVWGMVGVLRGAELVEDFARRDDGRLFRVGSLRTLAAGEVESFSPATGDIHRVANAYDDRVSISIHVYGADIGAVERATYDADGTPKLFISGYAALPALIP
ncbi:cysteine dioxygenase family protein [Flavisphingomonas formosensis]|uniref:cysteine dioxygenase family protein n=1 Tax=Flavisphingomonas formosensis TaxID=861534 RepID=UPI0012FAB6FB|nr:cysteine dioxygenase [Sphingomonas formosensis]